jgi:hypothetical protein
MIIPNFKHPYPATVVALFTLCVGVIKLWDGGNGRFIGAALIVVGAVIGVWAMVRLFTTESEAR